MDVIALGAALAVLVALPWPISLAVAQEQPDQPIIRARLEPEGAVVVGEPVMLVVEVLTPTWFPQAPRFALPDVENAIVEEAPDASLNLNERIGAATWAGLRRGFRIYPQVPGEYVVPPATVEVVYALPNARPSDPLTLEAGELRFEARVPAAAAGLDYFISARRFTLMQSIDPRPEGLKVGDAVTRTITMTAVDSSSMMLPPLAFEPIEGLAVYPAPPRTADEGGERGSERLATRVESVTYTLQDEGDYTLPEVAISWWDPAESALRTTRLPAVSFHVDPNPTLGEAVIALPPEPVEQAAGGTGDVPGWRADWRTWAAVVALLALASWGWRRVRRLARNAGDRVVAWRRARADGEAARFARFTAAARSGDARSTMRALLSWLDVWAGERAPTTLAAFAAGAADQALTDQLDALQAAAFGKAPPDAWSGAVLARVAARARKRLRQEPPPHAAGLPALNPPL